MSEINLTKRGCNAATAIKNVPIPFDFDELEAFIKENAIVIVDIMPAPAKRVSFTTSKAYHNGPCPLNDVYPLITSIASGSKRDTKLWVCRRYKC